MRRGLNLRASLFKLIITLGLAATVLVYKGLPTEVI